MAEQNHTDEIDMGTVYGVFQTGYRNLKRSLYKTLRFVFRNSLWLSGIIVVAFLTGWLMDRNSDVYEGFAIVQINFNTANTVYEEINLLNEKIREGDSVYLHTNGFLKDDELLISSIEIEPIVDFDNIHPRRFSINERYLQTIFEKSKFKDDLLTSDVFIPKYKRHKIKLESTSAETTEVFNALMNYLNANELLNELKAVSVSTTKAIIEENKFTINAIDSILKNLGNASSFDGLRDQIYINQQENTNFHMVIQEKSFLMTENEELIYDLLQSDFVVQLLNRPALVTKTTVIQKNKIVFPIVAIFLFLLLNGLKHLYNEGKRLESEGL